MVLVVQSDQGLVATRASRAMDVSWSGRVVNIGLRSVIHVSKSGVLAQGLCKAGAVKARARGFPGARRSRQVRQVRSTLAPSRLRGASSLFRNRVGASVRLLGAAQCPGKQRSLPARSPKHRSRPRCAPTLWPNLPFTRSRAGLGSPSARWKWIDTAQGGCILKINRSRPHSIIMALAIERSAPCHESIGAPLAWVTVRAAMVRTWGVLIVFKSCLAR